MRERAMEGVRVLDLTHLIAGPYCTKMMAGFGAEVLKIEKPGRGDMARHLGPFLDDQPGAERSGLFLYLNGNKKSILVVADSIDFANSIKQGLNYFYPSEFNIKCICYEKNYFKALKKKHNLPDLILFDLPAPGIAEQKILDCLKNASLWKDIPIIFLSKKNEKIEGKNKGSFIKRPFEISDLKITIQTVFV